MDVKFDLKLNPFRQNDDARPDADTAPGTSSTPPSVDSSKPLLVYGTAWCGDCYRSKRFLDRNGVPYTWIDIDRDEEGARQVIEINRGRRSVPTIVFPDGSTLTEPSDGQLGRKLGLR